jgi:hypothetical protein
MASLPNTPRTNHALAKTRVFAMMRTADETSRAMKHDKEWTAESAQIEEARQQRFALQSQRIHARQKEVAREQEELVREIAEEDELEKRKTMRRLIDTSRAQYRDARRQAFVNSRRTNNLYKQHCIEVEQRQERKRQEANEAHQRMLHQQDEMRAAERRQAALIKAVRDKQAEKARLFEERRAHLYERREEEAARKEAKLKEWKRQQAEVMARTAQFEAAKQAEWAERARASGASLMGTARAHELMLLNEHEEQLAKYEETTARMEQRVKESYELKVQSARAHGEKVRAVTARSHERKTQADAAARDRHAKAAESTHMRLLTLTQSRAERERKLERSLRDDFQVKTKLEKLRWQHDILKSPPSIVRQSLSGIA